MLEHLSSTHLRLHYHQGKIQTGWWLIDEKNSPPGLDGSMKNIMPHLSKWAMSLLEMITIPFSIHRTSHLGQPRVPTHYFPNLPAGTLWDCPTIGSTAISWGQMPSLLFFYTIWNSLLSETAFSFTLKSTE